MWALVKRLETDWRKVWKIQEWVIKTQVWDRSVGVIHKGEIVITVGFDGKDYEWLLRTSFLTQESNADSQEIAQDKWSSCCEG